MLNLYDRNGNLKEMIENGDIENSPLGYSKSFLKLPNGTAICYGWMLFENISITNKWGNGYYEFLDIDYTFPIHFVQNPCIILTADTGFINGISIYRYRVNKFPIVMVTSFDSVEKISSYVYYLAIGQWK